MSSDLVAELADDLAAAVLTVPGVVRLHAGALGEVGTYLPGRRVAGIRLGTDGPTEVHVVLRPDADVRAVAQEVHVVAHRLLTAAGVRADVRVHVDDLA